MSLAISIQFTAWGTMTPETMGIKLWEENILINDDDDVFGPEPSKPLAELVRLAGSVFALAPAPSRALAKESLAARRKSIAENQGGFSDLSFRNKYGALDIKRAASV